MADPSPARLYATLVGGILVIAGIVGFFYSASFGGPGRVEDVLGVFSVNAWSNVLCIFTGAIGLLVADFAARRYALVVGVLYVALAIWGFASGAGNPILGHIPANAADDFFHLAIGVLGVTAALATPRPARASAGSPDSLRA